MGGLVELDFRSSGEIEVSLLWHRAENRFSVQVIDWQRDEVFSIAVAPTAALDVLHHRYAYATAADGEPVIR